LCFFAFFNFSLAFFVYTLYIELTLTTNKNKETRDKNDAVQAEKDFLDKAIKGE